MARKLLTGPRIIGALVLVAVAIAVAFSFRSVPVSVDLGEVSRGPMVVTIDDLGETRVTDLFVVSSPVTGELLRVPLKPGDMVTARSTLVARVQPLEPAPIDARSTAQNEANVRALEAQLHAARSRVEEARAEQALAEREYARVDALSGRGFVSDATVDRARSARDRTRAAFTGANQSAEAVQHSLEAARAALLTSGKGGSGRGAVSVTSPVSGYVLRVPQESERVVVAGTPLVEIGNPERLEMVTDVLSADAVRILPGALVLIEDWGGEKPIRGRVRRVEPFGFTKISALGVEEQRVNVIIDFAEPREAWARLGHGYRASVRIAIWSVKDAIRVPVSALFRTGEGWTIFAEKEGRAKLVAVKIGPMNDEVAQVLGGLSAGDHVILHPSDKVQEGVRVRSRE